MPLKQREALGYLGSVEEAMVKGFPFKVPAEYADRPLLLVRSRARSSLALPPALRLLPHVPLPHPCASPSSHLIILPLFRWYPSFLTPSNPSKHPQNTTTTTKTPKNRGAPTWRCRLR